MKQAIHKYQTSDYMEWDVMLSLIRKLYRDGNYRMSLLIALSVNYTGMAIIVCHSLSVVGVSSGCVSATF